MIVCEHSVSKSGDPKGPSVGLEEGAFVFALRLLRNANLVSLLDFEVRRFCQFFFFFLTHFGITRSKLMRLLFLVRMGTISYTTFSYLE